MSTQLIQSLEELILGYLHGNPDVKAFLKWNKHELSQKEIWDEMSEYIQQEKNIYQNHGEPADELSFDIGSLFLKHQILLDNKNDFDRISLQN